MSAHLRSIAHRRNLLLFLVVLTLVGVVFFWEKPNRPLQVAVGKGGHILTINSALDAAVDQALARNLVSSDPEAASLLAGKDIGYLYATRLGTGESRDWRRFGCGDGTCAQVSFYNYSDGGTIEAILNLSNGEVVDRWLNASSRPGASPYIVPRALAIAAADERVTSVIGDIHLAEPMMVPMSAWLADDECGQQWCVDLTFMAPDQSGRIFHVFVNMEQADVARTFYTRGRVDRAYKRPAAQEPFFNNGCHEQVGWNVCWQMTANDGINFYDASFKGQPIFFSAKIGQVEAYYPSWPGGYRDEIGYASSVPPHYGTQIVELDDGFEVRQLYTEFLRWPNCICCYRYEQIMRFYANGTFEPSFISHGPGCDDLSRYRPFWRIDLALNEANIDETWYWLEDRWVEAGEEVELPTFEDLSPDGAKLFTAAGTQGYKWLPIPSDPLGKDEARLFVLRWNEGEGDGPIATGPADTYTPPRRWIDGENLAREHLVVWYIPTLSTKKGGPWWCMPDPEPDFSPCEAPLRIEPSDKPIQPIPEITPSEPAGSAAQATTAATNTPAPTPTPRPIAGEDAKKIILNSGCGSCHAIGQLGEAGKVGPNLSAIGVEASRRIPGLTAKEYLRQSILDPQAFIAPECPNGPCQEGIMPRDYSERLTPRQISLVVNFLSEQGVERVPEAIGQTPASIETVPTTLLSTPELTSPAGEEASASMVAVIFILTLSFTLLLVFWLVRRERNVSD